MTIRTRAPLLLAGGLLLIGGGGLTAAEDEATDRIWRPPDRGQAGTDLRREKRRAIRDGQWVFSAGAGASLGWTDNAFASPDDLAGAPDDIPRRSAFAAASVELGLERSFFGSDELDASIELAGTRYADAPDADRLGVGLDLAYDVELSEPVELRTDLRVQRENDSATDVFGEPYLRDYASWRYVAQVALAVDLGEDQQVVLGYGVTRKDYDETSGLNSLDWTENAVQLRYRLRAGEQVTLRLWSELGLQRYDGEPANSSPSGLELPGNPDEEHRLLSLLAWVAWEVDDRLELALKYRYRAKDDRFEGYESYAEHRIGASVDWWLGTSWLLSVEGQLADRAFDERPADTAGERLAYTSSELTIDLWRVLGPHVAGYVGYALAQRDSNRDTGTTYRSYTVNAVMTGLNLSY